MVKRSTFIRGIVGAIGLIVISLGASESRAASPRHIEREVIVAASPAAVWTHWTTLEGLQTLFIPPEPPLQGRIELRADGPYEMYFLMANPVGSRGGEGARVMAFQTERMLSFTWRNNPNWPEIRPFYTHVIVTLEPVESGTRVRLVQSGFGEGGEWDTAFAYFNTAWDRVLGRLVDHYALPVRQ